MSLGFSPAATRIRKKVTGRTKTEVRDKLRELHKQVEGGLRPRRRYTVEDALEDWLAVGLDGLSARTVTLYRGTIAKALSEELGAVRLTDLTAADVQKALTSMASRVSMRTVQIAHNVLVRVIRQAERDDLVGRNVAALVKPPKGQGAGRPSKSLTLEQAVDLMAAARGTAGRHRDRGGADAQAPGAPRAVGGRAVLGRLRAPGDAGRPGPGRPADSLYSLPVGAAIAFLMLAAGISYRQTIRAYPQGGGSFIVASEGTRPRPRRGRQLANYLWTLHEQRPDLTLTVAVPELVDLHWWHRILHEHVAERLEPVLQSLPRVIVTSVPLGAQGRGDRPVRRGRDRQGGRQAPRGQADGSPAHPRHPGAVRRRDSAPQGAPRGG